MARRADPSKSSKEPVLADNSNSNVHLFFDIYTPRSHFICSHPTGRERQEASDDDINTTLALIPQFLRKKPEYDEGEAILSFHMGCWYQGHRNNWHCHLYVRFEPYCNEAGAKVDPKYVQEATDLREKTKTKYQKYQGDCIDNAGKLQNIKVDLLQLESTEFGLRFMVREPRIAICSKQHSTTPRALYNYLMQLYPRMITIHKDFNSLGCHLCLFVSTESVTSARSATLFNSGNVTDVDTVGYIQMGAEDYYRILPTELKPKWLNEFSNNKQYIVHT
ncbi:unnamed protein product [Didymodactylos carnosus]|uniref:Uncharacterized protein n=1 Tax=Didymodactylos carnosus TaxID=1234261 RepID=A0A814RHF9_9BILA|nr:unnamed protein product [Didymodactylos carnosus]CAF3896800.1 unnamed protein product [Didymodactylos carnosus]